MEKEHIVKQNGFVKPKILEARPAEFVVIKRKINICGMGTPFDYSLKSLTKGDLIEVSNFNKSKK